MWVQTASGQKATWPIHLSEGINFRGCSRRLTVTVVWLPNVIGLHGSASNRRVAVLNGADLILAPARGKNVPVSSGDGAPGAGSSAPGAIVGRAPGGVPVPPRVYSLLRLQPRGFGSCYVVLPALIGPAGIGSAAGAEPHAPASAVPLAGAENDVSLGGGGLSVVSGTSPTVTGEPSRWQCSSAEEEALFPTSGFRPQVCEIQQLPLVAVGYGVYYAAKMRQHRRELPAMVPYPAFAASPSDGGSWPRRSTTATATNGTATNRAATNEKRLGQTADSPVRTATNGTATNA